jgi:1-acyl-sn-glycerol-3-phosphate acyltransferase
MSAYRTLLFLGCLFFGTLFYGISILALSLFGLSGARIRRLSRAWCDVLLRAAGVDVRVEGLENIDPNRPYILAANHQSWFDIFAILGKIPGRFVFLAKKELLSIPVFGPAMAEDGHIPIDRSNRQKAIESLNEAARRVRNGTSLAIFPEGTRSPDGVLQEFKKGGFILALQSKQPVLPVSISGSHRIMPKGSYLRVRPGTIRVVINAPIPTDHLTLRDRNQLIAEVREAIKSHLPPEEGGVEPPSRAA